MNLGRDSKTMKYYICIYNYIIISHPVVYSLDQPSRTGLQKGSVNINTLLGDHLEIDFRRKVLSALAKLFVPQLELQKLPDGICHVYAM